MLAKSLTTCIFLSIIVSCSSPDSSENAPDQAYFPLEAGRYSEFRIERTTYEPDETDQRSLIPVRRMTNEPFYRADGQVVFPFEYTSQKTGISWQPDSVVTAWQTDDRIFEQESGKPVIKINLPVYEGAYWNANAFNVSKERKCRAIDVDKPFQIGPLFFPNTITIVVQDDSTLLSRKMYIEIYARNVGLIRRERLNLQYCYTPDCVGKGVISSGWTEITTIQNFGKQ